MSNTYRHPLAVEFVLADAHITGIVDLLEDRRRLVDALNTQQSFIELANVQLRVQGGTPHQMATMSVMKSAILLALPRETREQGNQRAMQSFVVSMETMHGRAVLVVPPLTVKGVAHGPRGQGRLPADPAVFSHFFSVTEAEITKPNGMSVQEPVVLVNRDSIVALSITAEAQGIRPEPRPIRPPESRDELSSLLRRLASND